MSTRIIVAGDGKPYCYDAELDQYGFARTWEPWWWAFWMARLVPAHLLGDTERN